MAPRKTLQIPLHDLIACLADTIDLVSPELADHHRRVGYIASALATQIGLSPTEAVELLHAGYLHDIGALSLTERLAIQNFEAKETGHHAEIGALLLEMFTPFSRLADIVRYHHLSWDGGKGTFFKGRLVPQESHIVHLADRIAVLLGSTDRIRLLSTVRDIRDRVQAKSGTMFSPSLVAAFTRLATKEYFWLDLAQPLSCEAKSRKHGTDVQLDTDGLVGLSRLFARIIDFRSHFTATHSTGVAAGAQAIARLARRPEEECLQLSIAGLLHDLGKLAVPTELLEKPGKLTPQEKSVLRCHTFYTYRTLEKVPAFATIAAWSSYHHERLDGSGYPFHLSGKDIPLGARIVAVADVFTAITEDRPYRKGMSPVQVHKVLDGMVRHSALDPDLVALLLDHFEELDTVRCAAQAEATREYAGMYEKVAAVCC
ncbi:MAG TPA: HD domain-containing phosphohydrolase [Geobacteraceae bacterium]